VPTGTGDFSDLSVVALTKAYHYVLHGAYFGAGADDVEHDDAVVADVVVVVGDEVVGAVAAVADPQPFPTWNEDDHQ
jgi:phosphatidylglycerophosphatase A